MQLTWRVRACHQMEESLNGHGELIDDPARSAPPGSGPRSLVCPIVNVHIAETMRMSSNYSQ